MPRSPARPCKKPGCPGLVRMRGKRYCIDHREMEFRDDQARRRSHDRIRPSAHKRGYDSVWEKIRSAYLAQHPLCERCITTGLTEAAEVVHHIDEDATNNDPDNLQALSRDCHERLHGRKR